MASGSVGIPYCPTLQKYEKIFERTSLLSTNGKRQVQIVKEWFWSVTTLKGKIEREEDTKIHSLN